MFQISAIQEMRRDFGVLEETPNGHGRKGGEKNSASRLIKAKEKMTIRQPTLIFQIHTA